MRKKILITVGVLIGFVALLIVVTIVVGALLPRDHTSTSAITLAQPLDSVWPVVRDQAGMVEWWSDMESAERVDDAGGREVWRFETMQGGMAIIVEEATPPTLLVTRIDAPDDAAFGGTWTYRLEATPNGTRVSVTEDGFINNLFFRFMATTVFGLHSTMDGYLRALGVRFGEAVEPEHRE